MNTINKVKIRNGILTLPQSIHKMWKNKEVLIFPLKNQIIIQPLDSEWDSYEEKFVKGRKRISSKVLDDAIRFAKKQS